ncbi:MAG: serine/threonine protein kinase [Kofleriaceae bacterium]|nr:serine/threonine protein kinase [Kofleriaceae bacterium]
MALPASESGLVGQTLDGRYRIEAQLGKGGMGAVYRATHVHLEQRVAIKVLRPHLAGDPVAARRFAREAKGTFRLDSDHVIAVSDFGVTPDGLLYMVMEYLDGRTVADELASDGVLAPARAVHVAAQVCEALTAAHRLGFLHRDLKPDNIMLIRRGGDPDWVKVLDFGLAKLIEGAGGTVFSMAALTQKDLVFGTPEYMAPEQAMGQTLDARADLYALGATLVEMLTGRPPFIDDSPMRLLAKHVKAEPPSLGELAPALAPLIELDRVVRRCLAKRPELRPSSADELAAELRTLVATLPASAGGARVPAQVATSQTVDVDMVPPAAAFPSPSPAPVLPARADPPAPPAPFGEDTRGVTTAVPPGRTGRTAVIAIAAATLALGAVVVVAMSRGRGSRSASVSTSGGRAAAATRDARTAAPDAAAIVASAPVDAGAGADAAAPPPDAGPRKASSHDDRPPPDPALASHLAAAEAARRGHNWLRQLAEADAALSIDSHHLRARFLAGEALLETGDAANGCRYLRTARRLSAARAILSSGRCPAD